MALLNENSGYEAALKEYEFLVNPARERFGSSKGIMGMVSPEIEPRTMAAFLLHFSALSIPVTEPVEGWIRRAGERCEVLGFNDLASALLQRKCVSSSPAC